MPISMCSVKRMKKICEIYSNSLVYQHISHQHLEIIISPSHNSDVYKHNRYYYRACAVRLCWRAGHMLFSGAGGWS